MVISSRQPSPEEFEIAIICALPLEYDAVCFLFDDEYKVNEEYKEGRIGKHNVVLTMLSEMGKASAAGTAATFLRDYPKVRLALIVGVCGGVPKAAGEEVLLGDVVISRKILQYDLGRQYPNGYATKGNYKEPEKIIRTQLRMLETDDGQDLIQQNTLKHLKDLQAKARNAAGRKRKNRGERYKYPGPANDKLFNGNYRHKHRVLQGSKCVNCDDGRDTLCQEAQDASCDQLGCDNKDLVTRERLIRMEAEGDGEPDPYIHFGVVGSGDTVIKSAEHRDGIAKLKEVIAFEMEGAGISNDINSCIVIKGVSDYADAHKNKAWQNFAAAMAASTMKAMLERFSFFSVSGRGRGSQSPPPEEIPTIQEIAGPVSITTYVENQAKTKRALEIQNKLPGLVQTISEDLTNRLRWTPHLRAAPLAICVMATCLVAGNSPSAGFIEVNVEPVQIGGVTISSNKYLGTNLLQCSNVGKKAFRRAEAGMTTLQSESAFATSGTGPLAKIVLILNDSQPEFSSLEMWMQKLAKISATCQEETRDMKTHFEALLEFICRLQVATSEVFYENRQQLNKKEQVDKKEKATDGALAENLSEAKKEEAKLEAELLDAKASLNIAQQKMRAALSANLLEKIQAEIDSIKAELREIQKCEPSTWRIFDVFFRHAKRIRKDQDKRKQELSKRLENCLNARDKITSFEQNCAIDEFDTCQKKVDEAQERLQKSQARVMAFTDQKLQSAAASNAAYDDLCTLSDKTLNLEEIDLILTRSIQALQDLNKYIDHMSEFFMDVSSYVDDTMKNQLIQFKDLTSEIQKVTTRTAEENNIHKTSTIMTALDLHGRFTLINNIAGVYIKVSKEHVMPGIRLMNGLGHLDDDKYEIETAKFKQWGSDAAAEIEALATETNARIKNAVFNNMATLVQKHIGFEDSGDIGKLEYVS